MTKIITPPVFSRKERLDIFVQKGYTCNIEEGIVYNKWGKICGVVGVGGYVRLSTTHKVGDTTHKLKALQHHFVYYIAKNEIPEEIDHWNRIRHDNRIDNLRDLAHPENCWNTNLDNKKGYRFDRESGKWKSCITIKGKVFYLGIFDTELLARAAYIDAAEKRTIGETPLPVERKGNGYSFKKDQNKWYAYIPVNGKDVHLGVFDTEEEAKEARKEAEYRKSKGLPHPIYGAKGYDWHVSSNQWRARILVNKKSIFLGHFDKEEDARNAYLEACKKYRKAKTQQHELHPIRHPE